MPDGYPIPIPTAVARLRTTSIIVTLVMDDKTIITTASPSRLALAYADAVS